MRKPEAEQPPATTTSPTCEPCLIEDHEGCHEMTVDPVNDNYVPCSCLCGGGADAWAVL